MGRKAELGRDAEGRFRRYIGWKLGNGRVIQHLFRLGRDEEAAKLANMRLEQLWECVVARWKKDKAAGRTEDPCPLWDDLSLSIGFAIARGETSLALTLPPGMEGFHASSLVGWLTVLQQEYPVIRLTLPEDVLDRGRKELHRAREIEDNSRRVTDALLAAGEPAAAGGTLHEALDAYSAFIREKYKGKPSERPQLRTVALLRSQTEDLPLSKVDADRLDTWLAYWCRRPAGASGAPLAATTVRNTLIVLRQFLRWLARSAAFPWQMPGGYSFPRCKIAKLPAERVRKRRHFNLSELRVIWQYAKPWERALILLSLNCGFGKREIATLQVGEVCKGKKYTFIKRHRTKTDVYAEWVLWPETLEALKFLEGMRTKGGAYVVVNRAGNPMTEGTTGGNENQVIKNHWDNLFKRIAKEYPEFHKLPFKHLRKTGADLLRRLKLGDAAELSSMYLAHGAHEDSADKLLSAYTDRPWKKLHRALLKLRKKLLPIFTSVENPWEGTLCRTSPATVKKILELRRAGKKLTEIADEVGMHWVTVGKICRAK